MADEFGEVVQPLAERRQNEGKDVNAMKEVATEGILLDEIFQIAMSGDEDAVIHLSGIIASDALDLSLFEGAKQLGLHGKRHIADVVEEEGAAIGLLEFADMTGAGSGERAFLVAEEFGLDEFGGNGGAVEGDEGCFAARGFLVNGASDKLFAGTRFAQNADAGFTGGHAVDLSEELLHGGTRANELALAEAVAKLAVFFFKIAEPQGIFQGHQQLIRREGLFKKIQGAEPGSANRHFDIGLSGNENDGRFDAGVFQIFQQLEAAFS